MGTLMRTYDWQRTPLGPPDGWPQSLRTIANIVLSSRYAMWVGWGEDLTFFYNDAYRPTLGLKHPWALGRPAREVWSEIWTEIGPRIQLVLASGVATYDEGLLLFLGRSGFPEETYHTFSYSPLADDNDVVCGMLCVVTEETDRVIGERRMMTLRDLAARLASSNTEIEVCAAVEHELVKTRRTCLSRWYTCFRTVAMHAWHAQRTFRRAIPRRLPNCGKLRTNPGRSSKSLTIPRRESWIWGKDGTPAHCRRAVGTGRRGRLL
jgi:hypothetical protein